MSNKTLISVAESDFYFKEILLKTLLINPFYSIVKNCNNGHELISQLYYRTETVFIIDLYMPIMTGFEAIKHIRKTDHQTPIITYSSTFQSDMYNNLSNIDHVYYCQKKSAVIIDMLKNYVIHPNRSYSQYIEEWKKQSADTLAYMNRQKKHWFEPSLIEVQIMKLCYEGLSNKEIGQYLNLSSRTIDTYIANLTQKLGLRNKIDLIRFCVEHGYYNSST